VVRKVLLLRKGLFLITLVVLLPVCFADELQLTYDANGNLLSGDGFTRTYNSLNQLTRIENSTGSLLETFVYHPTEERIYKKIVYDSAGAVKETITYFTADFVRISNSSGTFDSTYVMHEGQKVAEVKYDGAKQFMHDDHLGSTGAITDSSGLVVEQTTYSPFGEIVSGGEVSRYDYEGKEFDSVVGDYDFHFRKYCVKFGIFCQPDTLIQNVYDPQSLNRYMFERGNPYKYVDEDGHLPIVPVIIGAAALIGGVANVINYYSTHEDTSFSGAATYFGTGALAGGAAAVGAIGSVGASLAIGAAFLGGATGKLLEDVYDDVSLKDDIGGILGAGALNAGASYLGGKLFPTKQLNKNIASMRSLFSLPTTKSGQNFLSRTSANTALSYGLLSLSLQSNQKSPEYKGFTKSESRKIASGGSVRRGSTTYTTVQMGSKTQGVKITKVR